MIDGIEEGMKRIRRRVRRLQVFGGAVAMGVGFPAAQASGQEPERVMGITSLVRTALDGNRDPVIAANGLP